MAYVPNINTVPYFPGQIANSNPVSRESLPNTSASTASVPFGCGVTYDGTNSGWALPVQATDVTNGRMGVAEIIQKIHQIAYDSSGNVSVTDPNLIPNGQQMSGVTAGFIAVTVEEAVNIGDPCFIRFANGSVYNQKGAFRKSADTVSSAATAAQHPTWVYVSKATALSTAIVQVK